MSGNSEIFLFQNIRQVILAEQWCVENKLDVKVIPVPRPYSSECGMCLEMDGVEGDLLSAFLIEREIVAQRIQQNNHH
jgi:hypothetical protein